MRPRFVILLLASAGLLFSGGTCLVSDLSNDFDLKSPQGYLLFLGAQAGCRFDEGAFDSCTFGP